MGADRESIARDAPGWREHALSQLRYFRSLTLRQKLEAVEGMADVVRRFEQMRKTGAFRLATPPLRDPGREPTPSTPSSPPPDSPD